MNAKIVNHYGMTVNPEVPTTGVIGINDINSQVLNDAMFYEGGINLDYENWNKSLEEISEGEYIPDPYDDWEDSPDDTWLIGDWTKDDDGLYISDRTGEYSAIVNESTIQVVWSKYIIRVQSLCSPCYPGQANIEVDDEGDYITSENGYLCYNLPDEFYDKDY